MTGEIFEYKGKTGKGSAQPEIKTGPEQIRSSAKKAGKGTKSRPRPSGEVRGEKDDQKKVERKSISNSPALSVRRRALSACSCGIDAAAGVVDPVRRLCAVLVGIRQILTAGCSGPGLADTASRWNGWLFTPGFSGGAPVVPVAALLIAGTRHRWCRSGGSPAASLN